MLRTFFVAISFLLGFPGSLFAQYPTENNARIHQVAPADEAAIPHSSFSPQEREPSPLREKRQLLSLSQHRQSTADTGVDPTAKSQLAGPAVTVTSSLAVVLGLFALMIWMTRRFGNRALGQTSLPNEVLQSLGTATLDARTKLNLLRCGSRVIVVAQTATGVFPISEFTSPDEVRHLIASCQPGSKQSFAQTLQGFENERAPHGFVGQEKPPVEASDRRKRGRLFATA